MSSRSIRKESLPKNAIVLTGENTIPDEFTYSSILATYFAMGTCSANPGASGGANSHLDPAVDNCHTHAGVNVASHTHTVSWLDASPIIISGYGVAGNDFVRGDHTHDPTTTSTATATVTVGSALNNHYHSSTESTPPYTTMHFMKHGSTISMRKKRNNTTYTLMTRKNLACLTKYTIDTNTQGKFIKSTANASSPAYETGGSCTHQHGVGGDHAHSLVIGAHTHAFSGNSSDESENAWGQCTNGGNIESTYKGHVHSLACKVTGAVTCAASSVTNAGEGNHTHPAANNVPLNAQLVFVKRSIISIRENGIAKGDIVGWLENLACIPAGWQLGNGTNGTLDLRNRFIQGAPACANPGTLGGATTHTHGAVTHTHSVKVMAHSHTTSALSISGYTSPVADKGTNTPGGATTVRPQLAHAHAAVHPSDEASPYISSIPQSGSHQHGAVSNNPQHKTIAWIEKL